MAKPRRLPSRLPSSRKPLCYRCRRFGVYLFQAVVSGQWVQAHFCEAHASEMGYQANGQPLHCFVEVSHA